MRAGSAAHVRQSQLFHAASPRCQSHAHLHKKNQHFPHVDSPQMNARSCYGAKNHETVPKTIQHFAAFNYNSFNCNHHVQVQTNIISLGANRTEPCLCCIKLLTRFVGFTHLRVNNVCAINMIHSFSATSLQQTSDCVQCVFTEALFVGKPFCCLTPLNLC